MHGHPPSFLWTDAAAVKHKSLDRRIALRAWRVVRPFRWWIAAFLVTIIIDAVLALLPPLLFRSIVDRAIPRHDRGLVWLLASFIVGAALLDAVLAVVQRWFSAHIGEGVIHRLRVQLFDRVQNQSIAFFTRSQTGALISRLNNDVIGAQDAVTGTLGSIVSNLIVLFTTLTAMIVLEWRLTLLTLVVLPLFILPAKRTGRRLQRLGRERMNLNAEMNTQMTEQFNVAGALLVKLYGRHADERDAFDHRAARVRDTGISQAMLSRILFVALGLVSALGAAAIYGLGAQLVISNSISTGTLFALAAFVTRIYSPLTGLTNARVDLMTALVSFERVFEVLDAPIAIDDRPGAVDLENPRGRIEVDHVTFHYPADTAVASLEAAGTEQTIGGEVLHDVSLTIQPGQMVALVGPSGAGKTTLAALVPRLYDVSSGVIRVDGFDVRDLTQTSLRAAIGVVAQDPHLFHESVQANLRYARPGATDEELIAACRAARIHDTLAALPDGYDTVVGERGYRLSGGEKQRLAIARMLLKDPAIVILDEATSHLDSENEAAVQAALEHALEGRTSIVIAHRLSTVRDADLICVIDEGRVVERGTHTTLLAAGGLYADLYHTLVRDDVAPDDVLPDAVLPDAV